MILIDNPSKYRGFGFVSYAISTLKGKEGYYELLDFLADIALDPSFIQNKGEYNEHVELRKTKIDIALDNGYTQVPTSHLVACIWAKQKNKQPDWVYKLSDQYR